MLICGSRCCETRWDFICNGGVGVLASGPPATGLREVSIYFILYRFADRAVAKPVGVLSVTGGGGIS